MRSRKGYASRTGAFRDIGGAIGGFALVMAAWVALTALPPYP